MRAQARKGRAGGGRVTEVVIEMGEESEVDEVDNIMICRPNSSFFIHNTLV